MKSFLYLAACTVLLLTACQRPHNRRSQEKRSRVKPAAVRPRDSAGAMPATRGAGRFSRRRPAAGPRVTGGNAPVRRVLDPPFKSTEVARFNEPWAMTFLPDGRLLVTEKQGHSAPDRRRHRQIGEISGVPAVAYGGQGGFGDVVLHPQFASNRLVYLSYAEAGPSGTRGAAVARATFNLDAGGNNGSLSGLQVVWRQVPEGDRGRPVRPPHRLRPVRQALDQLGRAPEIHAPRRTCSPISARSCA